MPEDFSLHPMMTAFGCTIRTSRWLSHAGLVVTCGRFYGLICIFVSIGASGVCLSPLDIEGVHAGTFQVGGHVIASHDCPAGWLQRWLSEGWLNSEMRLEQVLPEELGRIHLLFKDAGATLWVDFSVTLPATVSVRSTAVHARNEGRAAKAE